MIQQITQRLSEVNTLVATCNQDGFSFGPALSLSLFYRDFNDTNSLVKEAGNLARENPARLLECSISLLSETDGYLSADRSGLYAADFERIFEEHHENDLILRIGAVRIGRMLPVEIPDRRAEAAIIPVYRRNGL